MINLPSIVTLKPDELLYSFILRLANANGFKNLTEFTQTCVTKTKHTLSYDVGYDLYKLMDITDYEDIQSFYLQTSIFSGISPLNNRTTTSYYLSDYPIFPMISELKYCPECIKDGYYQRAHQMPGVTVCYKHNKPLHTYIGPQGKELSLPLNSIENPVYKKSFEYAVFCKDFLNASIEVDLTALLSLIPTDRNLDSEMIDYFDLMTELPSSFLKSTTTTSKNHSKISLLVILLYLFKDIKTLLNYIHPKQIDIHPNYKLLSTYREDIVELKCLKCNTPFLATPSKIKCTKCNSCYNKNKTISTLRTSKDVNDFPDDFILVDYTNKATSIVVKHKLCNQTFRCNFYTFYNNPRCKICQPFVSTENTFKNDIKMLTNNEYLLVNSYVNKKTKVDIKHLKCGKIHSYFPKHFIDGSRCPYCKNFIRTENLADIISMVSQGRLTLDNMESPNLLIIKDNQTNKLIKISPQKILQELYRPTKSTILPLENRNLITPVIGTKKDMLLNYLKENYNKNDLIFIEDITIEGITYITLKKCFETLKKEGILFFIEKGIYSFCDKSFSTNKLIDAKYLWRNGTRIGYLSGKTLAYKLGLRDEKLKQIDIVTNKEAQTHGRSITYRNVPIKIHGSKVKITNDNYAILATMNFLVNEKRCKYATKDNVYTTFYNWLNSLNIKKSDFDNYYKYFPKWTRKYINILYREDINGEDNRGN